MSRVLNRERAAIVVIDVQEAFRPVIEDFDRVVDRVRTLVRGARTLGIRLIVTEQYPRGLGATVPELDDDLDGIERLDKLEFSACRTEGFDLGGRSQVLICGIETHVCVSQTAHDLLDAGVEVHVATDAVSSRSGADREVGIAKMRDSGAVLSSVETGLLELLARAGSDEFKAVQRLIR